MEDILDAFFDVGYTKLDLKALKEAITNGPKSIFFTELIHWISNELRQLYSLDEYVNSISSADDSSSFLMELSSFLKEIGCCYSILTEGHLTQRLQTESSRILLLDYLLTELKSAQMIQTNKPDSSFEVKLNETTTATELKNMLMTLKFPKPPANIPPKTLFSKVEEKIKEILSKVPLSLIGDPLFVGKLSDKQWHALDSHYKEILGEYRMRREMLLKRLDVTIQSFEWSDRLKVKSSDIKNSFHTVRCCMTTEPKVKLSDILAARQDLAILEKTSSASVRKKTKSDVNKVMIGRVPDRGGRPYEQEPPPPEMPSWQQRNTGGQSAPRGGRGGGARNNTQMGGNQVKQFAEAPRGGRVQAGWSGPGRNFQGQSESTGYDQYDRGNQYSKRGGYQNSSNQGVSNYGGNYQPSGNSSYDNRQYRGHNSNFARGGGHQNDRKEYQDYRNRNESTRNYYQR